MRSLATFSEDRLYRYTLWRENPKKSSSEPYVAFIGLNPSTADEHSDDPTIRRCVRFAKDFGYTSMCMVNLFAYRATDPRIMRRSGNPIGPDNDFYLRLILDKADYIIAAWGSQGNHLNRAKEVSRLFSDKTFYCLGQTKAGQPAHPLYLPKTSQLRIWKCDNI